MKFLIYGAGAIGCFQGGFLAHAGHPVTLFGRRQRMAEIRGHGLRVDGIFGSVHIPDIPVSWEISQISEQTFDVILFCVKAFDTENSLEDLSRLVKPGTLVVSLQNGLGNVEQIVSRIGAEHTVAGRIITGVFMPQPGHARVTVTADATRIGPVAGGPSMERVEEVAKILSNAGLPTVAAPDVFKFIWAKVLYNSALNPLSAILSATYGELGENPHTRRVMDAVIDEGFTAASLEGVPLFRQHPDEYRKIFYENEIPLTSAHRSSMLQSIEKGQRTEIDSLNGALVAIGRRHSVDLPVNATLTRIIKAKESILT